MRCMNRLQDPRGSATMVNTWTKWLTALAAGMVCVLSASAQPAPVANNKAAPVLIGFDGAYGQKTNTAPLAIELGAKAAMDESNRAGGVLGGRPLQLVTT